MAQSVGGGSSYLVITGKIWYNNRVLSTSCQLVQIIMSATLVKTASDIKKDIIIMQDYLERYRQLIPEQVAVRSAMFRNQELFKSMARSIDQGITQIAIITRLSGYVDENIQTQFYGAIEQANRSLQEFYDNYQKESVGRLFDSDLVRMESIHYAFRYINSLFLQVSKTASLAIIQELE